METMQEYNEVMVGNAEAEALLEKFKDFTPVWDLVPDGEMDDKVYNELTKNGAEFTHGADVYITGYIGSITRLTNLSCTPFHIDYIMIGVGYPTASAMLMPYALEKDHATLIGILNK